MIFLQDLPLISAEELLPGFIVAFLTAIAAFLLIFLVLLVAIYVYTSLAYMALARKAKYSSPGIAWIPIIGPLIITSSTAKMHWWPILLLITIVFPPVFILAIIVVKVFSIIWHWKTYDRVGKPGWWALFNIIQPVGLIFLGIVAWSKK